MGGIVRTDAYKADAVWTTYFLKGTCKMLSKFRKHLFPDVIVNQQIPGIKRHPARVLQPYDLIFRL